jgi:hypothetical protein
MSIRTTVPPPNTRPHRRAHEPGDELTITTDERVMAFRQIGWHGQTGAFYALDEDPSFHEPGSFGPLWILVHNEPRVDGAA